jgi:hypothetical protein
LGVARTLFAANFRSPVKNCCAGACNPYIMAGRSVLGPQPFALDVRQNGVVLVDWQRIDCAAL